MFQVATSPNTRSTSSDPLPSHKSYMDGKEVSAEHNSLKLVKSFLRNAIMRRGNRHNKHISALPELFNLSTMLRNCNFFIGSGDFGELLISSVNVAILCHSLCCPGDIY